MNPVPDLMSKNVAFVALNEDRVKVLRVYFQHGS